MRICYSMLMFVSVASVLCTGSAAQSRASDDSHSLTPGRAVVEGEVRAFIRAVAQDVTRDGPAAWRKQFSDSPAFFMASEGRLVFADSASATAGIQNLVSTVKHIELQWGDDLRIDPLTTDLAVVGVTYHEIRVNTTGQRVDESGYFTGTAERRGDRWQFRNAHWSVLAPPPSVP